MTIAEDNMTDKDKKKILIVDDEPDILETLKFLIESEGFQSITAMDGEDALKKAKETNPDLIILDVMLPKINGYKVCRLLKFDNKYKHIPILMVTARSQEEDKVIGEETGADEYITKPFDIEELIEKVNNYINKV
jgi:DNA-binding response OmpR family regulator